MKVVLRGKRIALVVLVVIIGVPILTLSYLHAKMDTQPLPIGRAIPFVKFVSLKGESISSNNFRNSKTVLMVFSAECPHCIRMLAIFDSTKREYDGTVNFVGLSVSNADTTAKLVSASRASFPVFLDRNNEARKALRVTAVPVTFLLDSGLVLRDEILGEISLKIEEKAVNNLIASK